MSGLLLLAALLLLTLLLLALLLLALLLPTLLLLALLLLALLLLALLLLALLLPALLLLALLLALARALLFARGRLGFPAVLFLLSMKVPRGGQRALHVVLVFPLEGLRYLALGRKRWEAATGGEELPEGAPAPVATVAGVPAFNPLEFIQFFATEQRAAAAEARASVREVADLHSRDVQQLMQHITTKDAETARDNSLKGQIETLSEGMQAVEGLRDTVAATLPAPEADAEPERSGVINTAVEAMVVESLRASVHQPGAPTPQASRARVVRPNGAQAQGGIPPAATRQRSN